MKGRRNERFQIPSAKFRVQGMPPGRRCGSPGVSRMKENFHVRFSAEGGTAMSLYYPIVQFPSPTCLICQYQEPTPLRLDTHF